MDTELNLIFSYFYQEDKVKRIILPPMVLFCAEVFAEGVFSHRWSEGANHELEKNRTGSLTVPATGLYLLPSA